MDALAGVRGSDDDRVRPSHMIVQCSAAGEASTGEALTGEALKARIVMRR